MSTPNRSGTDYFVALFESLPRQGPGSRECTARALTMCEQLPPAPRIVDLGCGAGAQTVDLAQLTGGNVVAVDRHAPFRAVVDARAAAQGLSGRVHALTADMTETGLPPRGADLVWSEGALYNIGLDAALPLCRGLLRPGGYLAFTEPVWRRPDVPATVRDAFAEYPGMGTVADVLAALTAQDFEVIGHFALPDAVWWEEFYAPMATRIAELREEDEWPAEALPVLETCQAEIDMFREHSDCYAYEFFVARPRG